MITPSTRQAVEAACQALCEAFALEGAYVVRVLGPRRHYLAGYGEIKPGKPGQWPLSKSVALFWHGRLGKDAEADVRARLEETVRLVERDMADA